MFFSPTLRVVQGVWGGVEWKSRGWKQHADIVEHAYSETCPFSGISPPALLDAKTV